MNTLIMQFFVFCFNYYLKKDQEFMIKDPVIHSAPSRKLIRLQKILQFPYVESIQFLLRRWQHCMNFVILKKNFFGGIDFPKCFLKIAPCKCLAIAEIFKLQHIYAGFHYVIVETGWWACILQV
eukprot:TRINITY_DN102444_c0_g1_i1.p3 TRINITY_DN102444_c0_g1~~TRINITY_DN102444_c0_g1_i1.p3  ORF type:complete len:124 (-),score=0.34 TRINITY_DN102444_c0_g1_i1:10-381(-)